MNTKIKSLMKQSGGFTVVELVVVIVVIGVLASIATVSYIGTQNLAQKNTFEATAQQVKLKLGEHRTDKNGYPANKAAVVSYLNAIEGGTSTLATDFNKNNSAGAAIFGYTTTGCSGSPSLCTSYTITVTRDKWNSTNAADTSITIRP